MAKLKGRTCALKLMKYFLATVNFLTMMAGGELLIFWNHRVKKDAKNVIPEG